MPRHVQFERYGYLASLIGNRRRDRRRIHLSIDRDPEACVDRQAIQVGRPHDQVGLAVLIGDVGEGENPGEGRYGGRYEPRTGVADDNVGHLGSQVPVVLEGEEKLNVVRRRVILVHRLVGQPSRRGRAINVGPDRRTVVAHHEIGSPITVEIPRHDAVCRITVVSQIDARREAPGAVIDVQPVRAAVTGDDVQIGVTIHIGHGHAPRHTGVRGDIHTGGKGNRTRRDGLIQVQPVHPVHRVSVADSEIEVAIAVDIDQCDGSRGMRVGTDAGPRIERAAAVVQIEAVNRIVVGYNDVQVAIGVEVAKRRVPGTHGAIENAASRITAVAIVQHHSAAAAVINNHDIGIAVAATEITGHDGLGVLVFRSNVGSDVKRTIAIIPVEPIDAVVSHDDIQIPVVVQVGQRDSVAVVLRGWRDALHERSGAVIEIEAIRRARFGFENIQIGIAVDVHDHDLSRLVIVLFYSIPGGENSEVVVVNDSRLIVAAFDEIQIGIAVEIRQCHRPRLIAVVGERTGERVTRGAPAEASCAITGINLRVVARHPHHDIQAGITHDITDHDGAEISRIGFQRHTARKMLGCCAPVIDIQPATPAFVRHDQIHPAVAIDVCSSHIHTVVRIGGVDRFL